MKMKGLSIVSLTQVGGWIKDHLLDTALEYLFRNSSFTPSSCFDSHILVNAWPELKVIWFQQQMLFQMFSRQKNTQTNRKTLHSITTVTHEKKLGFKLSAGT